MLLATCKSIERKEKVSSWATNSNPIFTSNHINRTIIITSDIRIGTILEMRKSKDENFFGVNESSWRYRSMRSWHRANASNGSGVCFSTAKHRCNSKGRNWQCKSCFLAWLECGLSQLNGCFSMSESVSYRKKNDFSRRRSDAKAIWQRYKRKSR